MKPKKPDNHADLFRARLSQMLDPKEPLPLLGEKIDWEEMEEELGGLHTPGPGQLPLPTRLMAGLHFLKRAHERRAGGLDLAAEPVLAGVLRL